MLCQPAGIKKEFLLCLIKMFYHTVPQASSFKSNRV